MHSSKVMLCVKKHDEWTNAPEAICPSNFFEVGAINRGVTARGKTKKKKKKNMGLLIFHADAVYKKKNQDPNSNHS